MNVEEFFKELPPPLLLLFDELNELGFKVGIIGGTPRDFLFKGTIGNDFDCELRPVVDCNLMQKWQELWNYLEASYQLEKLSYEVIRLTLENCQVELTYPRLEKYSGENGHSNFVATYIRDENYTQGFKRRDFTINAILFEKYFEKINVIDPLGGQIHLKQRVLEACSSDFTQDPVRFLRALRFKINFEFEFSENLFQLMQKQSLKALSSHYLLRELDKCNNPMKMFIELCELRSDVINQSQLFVKQQDQLFQLYDHSDCGINGFMQAICWAYKIDHDTRKSLICTLGLSLKKYPAMLEHDFSTLVLKREKTVAELIEDDKFIEFAQWLSHAFKWSLPDNFFQIILNSFGLYDFSLQQFKSMQQFNVQLSDEEKAQYYPSQLKFVLVAKKFLQT